MSYGLVNENNESLCVKAVECGCEVTENFGVFTLRQKYCNTTEQIADASYVFPISSNEIIIDFKAYFGNEVVFSYLVRKRDADPFSGFGFGYHASDVSSFKVNIGKMAPGREIEIELKYIKSIDECDGFSRVVIPTVVTPNFTVDDRQYSFEGFDKKPDYDLSLDFIYHGCAISSAVCSTHDLSINCSSAKVTASVGSNRSSAYNIIIEIYKNASNVPAVYKYNNIIYCSFTPEIDVYNRLGRKYLFMINVNSKHSEEIKSAFTVCLRAMGKDDLFNIIMLSRQNSVFADDFLNATDDNVRAAAKWYDSCELGDSVELFSTVISSYKHSGNTAALLISDEKMSVNKDIINYIFNHKNNTYYLFEVDNRDDEKFLRALADATGGKYRFVPPDRRIDLEIISAFNVIAAPYISDCKVTFDEPVCNLAAAGIKKIHYLDRIGVIAEIYDSPPKNMYIDGRFSGDDITITVPLDRIAEGGSSMRYLLAKISIDELSYDIMNCSIREEAELMDKIVAVSSKYSMYNSYMDMLLMNYGGKCYDCVSIIRPKALPYDWYVNAMNAYDRQKKTDETNAIILRLVKKQHFNGSFVPSGSRSSLSIAVCTAKAVSKICREYPEPSLFIWQLRKAVVYLMKFVENNSESADTPSEVLAAFADWTKKFGGNNEISQKVAALAYLYMKN